MNKTVLVVEDEKAISRVLELKLSQSGAEVDVADNGQQAVDFVKQKRYDCVLLDLILPEKDGFEVLEHIRNSPYPDTKVIVLTNLGQPEDRQRVQDLGVSGYYVKSEMSIHSLVEKVKQMLLS